MKLWKIMVLGLLLRLLVVSVSIHFANYDLTSYKLIGELTRQGKNIYPRFALLHHPYFPVMLYLESLATFFGQYQTIFLKIVFSLFDTGIIYLIYLLTPKIPILRNGRGSPSSMSQGVGRRKIRYRGVNFNDSAFLYAINPISIIITSFHGQFDAVPLFLLLLALYLFNPKRWSPLPFFLISFAIAIKTWPALFIIPFLKSLKKLRQFLIAFICLVSLPVLSILLYSFFFHANPFLILWTIKAYRPVFGIFGMGFLIKNVFHTQEITFISKLTYLFLLVFFLYATFAKKKTLVEDLFSQLLIFFILTPVFGIQWLIWLVPFFLLVNPRGISLLFIVTTVYIVVNYLQLIGFKIEFVGLMSGILVWLGIIFISWQRYLFHFGDIKGTV